LNRDRLAAGSPEAATKFLNTELDFRNTFANVSPAGLLESATPGARTVPLSASIAIATEAQALRSPFVQLLTFWRAQMPAFHNRQDKYFGSQE
jgi:hypothetical protein